MRTLSAVVAIALSVSLVTPTFARGFGGGGFRGGGGGFGGGGFRGGGFGGGGGFHDFGGGGGGFHDFGGGGRDWGGGGDRGFSGSGDHDWGGGGGFGGRSSGDYGGGFNNIARSSDRPDGFNNGFGNRSWDGGGLSNRPGGGNRPFQPDGGFGNRGNHPLDPPDGGWGHLSNWNQHQNDFHNFHNNDWNSNSVRNSFNNFNNVNINNWGGGWGHWGGWGGYGWGFPGGWYCPGWSAAFAWTSFGMSTLTDFLGLGMLAGMAGGGGGGGSSSNNYPSVTNVTYEGPNVYVNGQPSGTSQSYYDENQQLANAGVQYADTQEQQSASTADQWKPLGVFSLAQPGQTQSTMLFQLAINKDGIIRGNYFNQLTNENSQVYGSLNKKTQMVSFTLGQNDSTIFDTRLADLTKDDAPVLVHYGPNSTQPMMLVRLKQPPNMPTASS